ncbi:hypothetical protein [Acidimangrovimonas pyrenivorans]|uniref:Uncharacterized protein n=1 Tax=Acidimangrovimonas pyrenivorans TaxID=2030798 RepID=A0ABV7AHI6_9RHOB
MAPKHLMSTTALLALLLSTGPSLAGKVSELGNQVEKSIASGQGIKAVREARKILDIAWAATPLTITNATLVATEAKGYGAYTPRKDNVYKPGETIRLYAEVIGFGYGKAPDGQWAIGLNCDLVVMKPDGTVLGRAPGALKVRVEDRHRPKEFQLNLTYHLSGAPPGKYLLETTVHDTHSDKMTSFETAVELRE